MNRRIVLKINPTQPVEKEISLEEYLEAQHSMASIQKEIDEKSSDVIRSLEIAEALEELAVVADNISSATREETQLIEIGGNIAVAGTRVDPASLIPSLESYVGGKISLEEFDFKGKLQKIWEAIVKTITAIIKKVKEFIDKSEIVLAGALNSLKKLEREVLESKNKQPKNTSFELDTSRFDSVLNNGKVGVSDPKEVISLLENSKTFYESFADVYIDGIVDLADKIREKADSITDQNINEVANYIGDTLNAGIPNIFNRVMIAIRSSNALDKLEMGTAKNETGYNTYGIENHTAYTRLMGGIKLTFIQPDIKVSGGRFDVEKNPEEFLNFIDRTRHSGINFKKTEEVRPSATITEPYSMEELQKIVQTSIKTLMAIKSIKDKGHQKRLMDSIDKLKKVLGDLTDRFETIAPGDLKNIEAIMSLNIAFTNWIRTPWVPMVEHAVRVSRAVGWLVRNNLEHYETVRTKPSK